MKTEVLIGIDAGSTHLKAALYTLKGELIAIKHSRVMTYHSQPSFSEYDAEEIFTQLCSSFRALLTPEYKPVAVGISSFGESVVPVDSNGNALDRAIAWYDMRGQDLIAGFAEKYGVSRLHTLTGQLPSGKFTLSKLLWMKRNTPEFLGKVHRFLFIQDYLASRLTGNLCTEFSLASRSMMFDISRLKWSQELLSTCGLEEKQMPIVIPSGTASGNVTKQASLLTGLPCGIPVILAGHDHASASVAAGIEENKVVLDSLGTSETSIFTGCHPENKALHSCGIGFYPYIQGKQRYLSSIQGCGFSIEWMARLLFEEPVFPKFFAAAGFAIEKSLDSPLFFPYLRGLQEAPEASGSITGLKDVHTKESLCYSVLEGLCFEYKRRMQSAEAVSGITFSRVRVAGRLSREAVFMQLKSDILGKPVEVLAQPEAVSQGAAILAGIYCGCMTSWKPHILTAFLPCECRGRYEGRYEKYLLGVDEFL